ncbi:MAG: hypothetical protein OXH36_00470, partial [Bdellovibrionales bacterium]|nr:hypothetical protein [Bdellovibrionales bacterium]
DEKKGLAELIRILLKQTKIPRIRLSSLEPIELSNEVLELFTSPRVCPHFHLSIQSVDSDVLQRMKRKYTAKDVEDSLLRIHKKLPLAFVGMDLIAGFAGESQKQFEDAYFRLKDWPWTKIHVFPYSPRRYTYAEKAYSAWPRSLVMKRAALLRHLSEERLKKESQKQIGSIKYVLPLRKKEQIGISRDYWKVSWSDRGSFPLGTLVPLGTCVPLVEKKTARKPLFPWRRGSNQMGISTECRMYIRSVNEKDGCLTGDFVEG